MGIALVLVALLWPAAGLAAWVLWLRARDVEADKGRSHESRMAEARAKRLAGESEAVLAARLEAVDTRLQRLESRLALQR